jgi:ubiquitin-conjugating enzyme E2 O
LDAHPVFYLPSPCLHPGPRPRPRTASPIAHVYIHLFQRIDGGLFTRYYLEPGYEKQRGTSEAALASRLYSECAYVFSRSFVRHALSSSVPSFDDEIRWLYLRPEHGRLPRIIAEAKRLIRLSEEGEGEGEGAGAVEGRFEEGAVSGKLTPGSVIPLRRTVAQLEKILDEKCREGSQS